MWTLIPAQEPAWPAAQMFGRFVARNFGRGGFVLEYLGNILIADGKNGPGYGVALGTSGSNSILTEMEDAAIALHTAH